MPKKNKELKDDRITVRCKTSTRIEFNTYKAQNHFSSFEEMILVLLRVAKISTEVVDTVRGFKPLGVIRGIPSYPEKPRRV